MPFHCFAAAPKSGMLFSSWVRQKMQVCYRGEFGKTYQIETGRGSKTFNEKYTITFYTLSLGPWLNFPYFPGTLVTSVADRDIQKGARFFAGKLRFNELLLSVWNGVAKRKFEISSQIFLFFPFARFSNRRSIWILLDSCEHSARREFSIWKKSPTSFLSSLMQYESERRLLHYVSSYNDPFDLVFFMGIVHGKNG